MSCDCSRPTHCAHAALDAAEWAGRKWREEEPYRLRIAQEAGEREWQMRQQPGFAEALAAERARFGLS